MDVKTSRFKKSNRPPLAAESRASSSAAPIGQLKLSGSNLLLEFRYSPERVEEIKKFRRARFIKEQKHWVLPLELLDDLKKSEHFNPSRLRYAFSEEELQGGVQATAEQMEAARARYRANPFAVSKADIAVLDPELYFCLDSSARFLLAVPKFSSKVRRILERHPGCHYLDREKGYFFPVQDLSAFLKRSRGEGFSFCVEEHAGKKLAETAALRAELMESPGDAEQYRTALLLPFLGLLEDYSDEPQFAIWGYTAKQLRDLLPQATSFAERRALAQSLKGEDVLALSHRAQQAGHRLYYTRELSRILELRREEFEERTLRLNQEEARERAERLARRKYFQALRDAEVDSSWFVEPELGARLYPHQRVAISWLRENERAFLGDDMGLGKTLSVLAYYESLLNTEQADFLLVVCPNSLVKNWIRENKNWFPERRLLELPDKKSDKLSFFKKIAWGGLSLNGLVINYEAVRLDYILERVGELLQGKKVLLCLDESQRVKNSAGKTFKALLELAPLCPRRVLLSGTPTPKDISDIWAQMRILDDGQRLGKNFYDWLGSIAELGTKYSDFAVKKYRPEALRQTISRVHEVLLRRRKEEVVNLPEKTFTVLDIELGGEQLKRYEEVRKDLLLRVTNLNGKTFVREINNILEEYLRAVQLASNPRLVDENFKGEPAKFKELDQIVKEVVEEKDEKLVIWTNYLGNVRELCERYKTLGVRPYSGEVSTLERDKTVAEFQSGDSVKILVAVPAAGGVGITLTRAQTAVYLDKTWNAEHYLQSIDRIHRIGQTGTVNIIALQAGKIDELIDRSLKRKAFQQKRLLGDQAVPLPSEVETDPSREELLEALR